MPTNPPEYLLDLAYEHLARGGLAIEPPMLEFDGGLAIYQFEVKDGGSAWRCEACEADIASPRTLWAVHGRPFDGSPHWFRRWACSATCARKIRARLFPELLQLFASKHPHLAAELQASIARIERMDPDAPELQPFTIAFSPRDSDECETLAVLRARLQPLQYGFPQPTSSMEVVVPRLALGVALDVLKLAGWSPDPVSRAALEEEQARLPGYPFFPDEKGYDQRYYLLVLELYKAGVDAELRKEEEQGRLFWYLRVPGDAAPETLERAYLRAGLHFQVPPTREAIHAAIVQRLEEIGRQIRAHAVPWRASQVTFPLAENEE
jgi:hypothetical protein